MWLDGKLIAFEEARVHVLTHSVQYGSGIFEGIRIYQIGGSAGIFRLDAHLKRFLNSAKIYSMDLGFGAGELKNAIIQLVKRNRLKSGYVRPFAFYNDTHIGLRVEGKKISVVIAAVPFGNYFENKDKGIRCVVSSWRRINSELTAPQAKASGNYLNSIVASLEARNSGVDEAIMLAHNGYVAEGPGENIFLVKDGSLITPSESSDILMGITRDSIIKIAENTGVTVAEREVHREELYTCDELFFCGTAAEITPIVSVDHRRIGNGRPGPVTRLLADAFDRAVKGEDSEFKDWLTMV